MTISTPQVYRSTGPVVVRTMDGVPFYARDGATVFTLPAGSYHLEGKVVNIGAMRPRAFRVPRPRRPLPDHVAMFVGDNPHKASINTRAGVVFMDRSLLEAPEFCRAFVLGHEIGHYFHNSERGADAVAARWMWSQGYNPSQIHAAAAFTLSETNQGRIACTAKIAQRYDGRRKQ